VGRQTLSSIVYRVLSVSAAADTDDERRDIDGDMDDDIDDDNREHAVVVTKPHRWGPNRLSDMKAKADICVIWKWGIIISMLDIRKETKSHHRDGTTLQLLQAFPFNCMGSFVIRLWLWL
jgi:hypothetical protein